MLIYLIVICRHESIPTSKDLSSFLLSLHCSSSYFFRYFPYMVFSTAGVLLVKGVSIPTKAHIAIYIYHLSALNMRRSQMLLKVEYGLPAKI